MAMEELIRGMSLKDQYLRGTDEIDSSIDKLIDEREIAYDRPFDEGVDIRYPLQRKGDLENWSEGAREIDYILLFAYDGSMDGAGHDYLTNLECARQDFTNRLDKALSLLPRSLMGGVLGFTYLGSGKMTRRDDLVGEIANMVDVHEAIHTPDEYETRRLTDWMLTRERPKYKN